MSNNENKNEMLSFEELRKQLGISEEDLPEIKKDNTDVFSSLLDDIIDEKEINNDNQEKEEPTVIGESKLITENGRTFVDITEQYVSNDETPVTEEKKDVAVPVVKKKRIRTFNEIFSDFFGLFIPLHKDSLKEKVRKVVMDISIIAIICCVFALSSYFIEQKQQISAEDDKNDNLVNTDKLDDNQYVEAWQDSFIQHSDVSFPEGMDMKYSYLYSVNQDLVGWLKIDNTNLDVQVVQSSDNDYYLDKDFYGNKSHYGCPYLDYKNDIKELDDNTIIYGYNTADGLVFANLEKYKTLEGYKESPIISFSTLYKTYTFKVFAAFLSTDSPVTDGELNYMVTDFSSDSKFIEFIDEVKLRSMINTDVSVQTDDKIITLVTSSHEFDNARLVVMGRMVRENESPTVDVNMATLNTSPKYPQLWYDKKGIANPYAE